MDVDTVKKEFGTEGVGKTWSKGIWAEVDERAESAWMSISPEFETAKRRDRSEPTFQSKLPWSISSITNKTSESQKG